MKFENLTNGGAKRGLAIIVGWSLLSGPTPALADERAHQGQPPLIVLVAFGTSVPKARQVYTHIEEQTKKAFPNVDIRWGFTSGIIVKKLRSQGIESQTLPELAQALKAEGHRAVVLQSLHMVPGEEFESIKQVDFGPLPKAYGEPLLTSEADIEAVIAALQPALKPDRPNVIVMHGNDKHPEFNTQLLAFTRVIESKDPNVIVASVEGQPGTDGPLKRARELAVKSGAVHFIPMMIVAGDHIMNDVLGDEPDSWKNRIGAKSVTCADPLGANDAVIAVFHAHLRKALTELKSHR